MLSRYTSKIITPIRNELVGYDPKANYPTALSEYTINENFKSLSEQPEVCKITYTSGMTGWCLRAKLLPPIVSFDSKGGENPDVCLQFRFQNGTANLCEDVIYLDSWIIAVKARLDRTMIFPDTFPNPREAARLKDLRQKMNQAYDLHGIQATASAEAGDNFSLHRVFLNVPEPSWSNIVMKDSSASKDGNKVPLDEFLRQNDIPGEVIFDCLKGWAQGQQGSPIFTLGLELRLHQKDNNE